MRRQAEHGRCSKQRDRVEKHNQAAVENSGGYKRQSDLNGNPYRSCAEHSCRVLHLGGDCAQSVTHVNKDVGNCIKRTNEDQPAERIHIEQATLGPAQKHPDAVDPAGIGTGQQDPRNGAEIRRYNECAE